MDEATSHPKWADPPFDAAGIREFRSRCDKKLRILGNLFLAKQAADSDAEGVRSEIAMVKFQVLAMRKPEKQLRELKNKRTEGRGKARRVEY